MDAKIRPALAVLIAAIFTFYGPFSLADTHKKIPDPITLLIKFHATGTYAGLNKKGQMVFDIRATGRVPHIMDDGVVVPRAGNSPSIATLTGAKISFANFDFSAPPKTVPFTCKGCVLTFKDGSVLKADPSVPLHGRALFVYGPVNYNPNKPYAQTIRMAGCSGLRETASKGLLAGKVGSICFNGVFNFNVGNLPYSLKHITGSSDCTITMHTPMQVSQ